MWVCQAWRCAVGTSIQTSRMRQRSPSPAANPPAPAQPPRRSSRHPRCPKCSRSPTGSQPAPAPQLLPAPLHYFRVVYVAQAATLDGVQAQVAAVAALPLGPLGGPWYDTLLKHHPSCAHTGHCGYLGLLGQGGVRTVLKMLQTIGARPTVFHVARDRTTHIRAH